MQPFIFVVTSIIDAPQKAYPTKNAIKLVMLIHFCQRLALLLPHDAYGVHLFADTQISLFKSIIGPFGLSALLFSAKNDTLTMVIVTIAITIVYTYTFIALFLAMAYKFEFYNPGKPRGYFKMLSGVMYNGLMYVEQLIYIPFAKVMIGSIVCDENSILIQNRDSTTCQPIYFTIVVVIGLICLMGVVTISNFYFRTYQLQPDNNYKKKFTMHSIIIPYLNVLIIGSSFLNTSSFTVLVRCILANLHGLMWMLEIYFYCPFVKGINKQIFIFACLYEQFTILLTLSVAPTNAIIQPNQLFYWWIIMCTLVGYLASVIYDARTWKLITKKLESSQYLQVYMVQNMQDLYENMMKQEQDHVQWYYCVMKHLVACQNPTCCDLRNRISTHGVENFKSTTRTVISCILHTNLERQLLNKDSDSEFIQLVMIWFQAIQCQQSLPAYLSLKVYQKKVDEHSFYFKCVCTSMNELLKNEILIKQYQKRISMKDDHSDRELSVMDVHQSNIFDDIYLPKLLELIDLKFKYWEKIINGYQNINDFANFTIRVSECIMGLHGSLENEFGIGLADKVNVKLFTTVPQLKLLSLYFAVAVNDLQNCVHCEYELEEILQIERSFNQSLVTNTALINQKVILMSIGTIKNRGTIINKERAQYASFFNYDKQSFNNVTHINQLMPPFIRKRHDQILDRYLQIGQSDRFSTPRIVFTLSIDGFLNAAHIRLNNFFESQDDYILSASFSKVKENADYLLFDAKGKIIGITNGLFNKLHDLACPSGTTTQQFSLETLLSMGYAFILFPDITEIIKTQREELIWSESEEVTFDLKTTLCIPKSINQDFFDYKNHKTQSRVSFNQFKTVRSDKELIRVQSEATNEFADNEGTFDVNFNDKTHLLGCHIPLLEHTYQESIYEFNNNQSNKSPQLYSITYQLRYRVLGNGNHSFPYFFLEISEIRTLDTTYRTTVQSQNIQGYPTTFVDCDLSAESPHEKQYVSTISNVQGTHRSEEIFIGNELNHDFSQIFPQKTFHHNFDAQVKEPQLIVDSNRSAPMSRRAIFENPMSIDRKIDPSFSLLDKEFKELINVSNMNNSVEQFNKGVDDSIRKQEESFQKISSQRQDHSHNIKQLLMHKEDNNNNEGAQHQSQHSYVTTTSNTRDTMQMIRSIKHNRSINSSLKAVLLLLFTQLSLQLLMVGIKIALIQNNTATELIDLDDIIHPYELKQMYQRVMIFGWVHFYNHYGLVTHSPFINQSIMRSSKELLENVQEQMQSSYNIFVKVEDSGLIPEFEINYILQANEYNSTFSKFYFMQKQTFERVLQSIISQQVNQQSIVDILFLQNNVALEFRLIDHLIESLDHQFRQVVIDKQSLNLTLFFLFLLLLGFLNFSTMIFWSRILDFQQRILINNSRLSEKQAQAMLIKLQLVREILNNQQTIDWKKVDYFKIIYNQLQDIDLHALKVDTTFFRRSLNSDNNSERAKKSTNRHQILSSRIQHNTFSCMTELILLICLFLIMFALLFGGYQFQTVSDANQEPTQQLALGFIEYSIGFNELILYAFTSKLYYVVMPYIIENKLIGINEEMFSTLADTDVDVQFLAQKIINTDTIIQDFYGELVNNVDLNSSNRKILLELYHGDFCASVSEQIEFCNYNIQTADEFQQKYGRIYDVDNNIQYIRDGILGQYTKSIKLITENYEIELNSAKYNKNTQQLMTFLNSDDFINGILQHQLNYIYAYDLFINTLFDSTSQQLTSSANALYVYYLVAGIGITLLIGFIQIWYVRFRNHRLHMIRLGIVNIPMEILQDVQMKQFLRIIEKN